MVWSDFDVSRGQVTNVTLAGHLLFPGFVRRTVKETGSSIAINTYGEGYGRFPLFNVWFADPLWSRVDSQIENYVIGGGYF